MPAKSKSKAKNNALPPYLEPNNGRPRWNPGPKLKALGWRSRVLLGPQDEPLDLPEAITRARQINAAVAAFLDGVPVPPAFADFAPASAVQTPGKKALHTPVSHRSIGYLLDTYLTEGVTKLSPKSLKDYEGKIRATLQTIAGLNRKDLSAIRAADIILLKEPDEGSGLPFHLLDAYDHLLKTKGPNWSRACLTATSAWLSWVKFKKRLLAGPNPCLSIKCETVEGRTVTWDDDEIAALVEAADYVGLPSIGDAIILALDLSWAQQDVLAMTWSQIQGDHAFGARLKTGVTMFPQLGPEACARLADIRRRHTEWPPLYRKTEHVVCSELDHQPWKADYFRHWFSMIRDIASAEAPYGLGNNGVREKRFQDLRDTAITKLNEMGISDQMIATRSGHQFGSVTATTNKHYSERKRIAKAANLLVAERRAANAA